MRTSRLCVVAALAAAVFLGTKVQAADLGPSPLPPLTVPVENWTGFSFAVGGGIGIFNANVNTFATRDDTVEQCASIASQNAVIVCNPPGFVLNETFSNFQDLSIDDLGDEGGFGTIQIAYDRQLGSQWVIGVWADADLYGGMDAEATQRSGSANNFFDIPITGIGTAVDFGAASTLTAKTEIGLDWGFSVGGRIGWLATTNTLLYFLAGYTYAELDKARLNVSTNAVFSTTQAGIVSLGGGCPVFGSCPLGLTVNLPDTLDGYTLGGGSEVKIGGGPWSIKAEYRYTHLEGESGRLAEASAQGFATFDPAPPPPPLIGIRRNALAKAEARIDDIDLHTVRAMLAYRF